MNILKGLFSKSISNVFAAIGGKSVIRGCTMFFDETEVPSELLNEKA